MLRKEEKRKKKKIEKKERERENTQFISIFEFMRWH